MLHIGWDEGGRVAIKGRFDASEAERVEAFLDGLNSSGTVDLSGLEYISSLGLGVFLKTQKRLRNSGDGLRLVGLPPHIREIFRFSGFDRVFEIDPP